MVGYPSAAADTGAKTEGDEAPFPPIPAAELSPDASPGGGSTELSEGEAGGSGVSGAGSGDGPGPEVPPGSCPEAGSGVGGAVTVAVSTVAGGTVTGGVSTVVVASV